MTDSSTLSEAPTESLSAGFMPAIGSETGFAPDEIAAPIRPSGFAALLLGLLSVITIFSKSLFVIPAAAIALGLYAVRRYSGPRPIGYRAAKIGLICAFSLGTFGSLTNVFRDATLAGEAKRFSREYIQLVAQNLEVVAIELNKDFVNRFDEKMPLETHYELNISSQRSLSAFRGKPIVKIVQARGAQGSWELDRPIEVFYERGNRRARVVWMDPTGETNKKIEAVMQWKIDPRDGSRQWHMERFQQYRDLVVAENVL